jgi:hypothetical protein
VERRGGDPMVSVRHPHHSFIVGCDPPICWSAYYLLGERNEPW